MKTGVEIIAEKAAELKLADANLEYAVNKIRDARITRLFMPYNKSECVSKLAYAGALIADEIDRLNNLKQ